MPPITQHASRGLRLEELTLAGTLETVPDEWDKDPVGWMMRQRTGSDDETVHEEFIRSLCKPEHRDCVTRKLREWDYHREKMNREVRDKPVRNVPMSERMGSAIFLDRLIAPLDDVSLWMLQQSSCAQCDWWDKLEAEAEDDDRRKKRGVSYDPNWRVFGKVRNSRWRWGCGDTWNLPAKIFNALPKVDIKHPRLKFDHLLTWTVGSNERGSSAHLRWRIGDDESTYVWLDGSMGYCLWVGDVWVATVGFAPMSVGVGILQIQFKPMEKPLRRKVLDGWDYKSAVIDAFKEAFTDIPLFMATGASLHAWILKSYTYSLSREMEFAAKDQQWNRDEEFKELRTAQIAALEQKIADLKQPDLLQRMVTRYAMAPKRKKLWNSNGIDFVPL